MKTPSLKAEVERLTEELAEAKAYIEQLDKSWFEIAEKRLAERTEARAERDALKEENERHIRQRDDAEWLADKYKTDAERLRKALEPFARLGAWTPEHYEPGHSRHLYEIPPADIWAARDAYFPADPNTKEGA